MIHLTALKPDALSMGGRWWCVTIEGAPNALLADYSRATQIYDSLKAEHPTWIIGMLEVII